MEMSAILLILQVYFLMKKNGEKRRANCITRRKMLRRRRRSNIEDGERMDIDLCLWMAMLSTYYSADPVLNTRIWSLPKSDFWWRVIVMETFKEEDWLSHFRMSRTTFEFLSTQLRPFIRKTDTHMRMAIGVDQRVGIALWRLATNVEYRTIAQLFGVGIATVCVIVHEVCKAIREALQDTMVRIPRGDAAIEVVREFEVKWGFPQCFGAVDGSHIPIISPKEYRADYYNRKGFHSMVLQGLVDHRYRFMNVNFGYPGSVHDARVFSNSSLYRLGNNGALCPPIQREINGTQVPVVILGDSAYPLLPWLQKPFNDNGQLTRQKRHFNYRLSRARMVVENAFGRLKGRWRILLKRQDTHVKFLGDIVVTCCILHNLCESAGENFNEELLIGVEPAQNALDGNDEQVNGDAAMIREALLQYFADV